MLCGRGVDGSEKPTVFLSFKKAVDRVYTWPSTRWYIVGMSSA